MSRRRRHSPAVAPVPQTAAPAPALAASRALAPWLACGLAVLTAAVYARVAGFDFVSWDDPWYVSSNPHVAAGLSWANLRWAFTTGGDFYWHPLTWLSHMLDVSLFGMNAGWHHVTSLLLHLANTLLLFALLRRMTDATWRSAIVAALFGVHPLHVESVAWVAERKDVLSTFFWLLAIAAYAWYAAARDHRSGQAAALGRYLLVLLLFALGLMAKPMIVTLPVVLLLLDAWPLSRWRRGAAARLVIEKLPLFALSLASAVATFIVQQRAGAIGELGSLPIGVRAAHALVSYWWYAAKSLVPIDLAAFYPYPAAPPAAWLAGLAAVGILFVLALSVRTARTRPYVIVGILWYFVTLAPVIGFFQAGDQLTADRFTYVPLIGLAIVAAWAGGEVAARWPRSRRPLATAAAAVVSALAVVAHVQVGYWRNTETLWTRALAVTDGNHRAHAALGEWFASHGDVEKGVRHYLEAIRLAPYGPDYPHGLGLAYLKQGKTNEARGQFERAVRLNPRNANAQVSLGAILAREGRTREAIEHDLEAVKAQPDMAQARHNLGLALIAEGRFDEAASACRTAAALDPASAGARQCLGLALARQGKVDEAIAAFGEAVRLDPGSEAAHVNLGVALSHANRRADALKAFESAQRINPSNEAVRQAIRELRGAGR